MSKVPLPITSALRPSTLVPQKEEQKNVEHPEEQPKNNGSPIIDNDDQAEPTSFSAPEAAVDNESCSRDGSHHSECESEGKDEYGARRSRRTTSSTSSLSTLSTPSQHNNKRASDGCCNADGTSDDSDDDDEQVGEPNHTDRKLPLDTYRYAPFSVCGRCHHVQVHAPNYYKGHLTCLCLGNAVCCAYGYANYLRTYPYHRPVPLPKLTFLMKYNIADPSCINALLIDDTLTKECHLAFERVQREIAHKHHKSHKTSKML